MGHDRRVFILTVTVIMLMVSVQDLAAESLYSLSKKGQEAYDAKDYQKAQDYFIKAQLDSPDNPIVYYNLGNAQYKNGDYDSALNHYKQALNSEDTDVKHKAHFNMGNTYFKQNDYEKSILEYEEALKIDPNDEDAKKNIAFVKKVMEEKQKQENQGNDEKDQDKDKKDQGQDKSKQGQDQKKDKQDRNKNQDKKDGSQDNKDQGGKDEPSENKDQPQAANGQDKDEKQPEMNQSGKGDENQPDDRDMKQAEKVLNRLKDQPGQALIPPYEQRQVDKDW